MHNNKWANNLKKSLTTLMITAMVLPNVGHALSPNEYFEKNSKDFTKLELSKSLDTKLKAQKVVIQEGINTKTNELVPIIVEFKSQPLVQSAHTSSTMSSDQKTKLNNINKDHEEFKEFINKKEGPVQFSDQSKIEHEYKNTFNGISMKMKGTDIEKLLESNVVKNIWPDKAVKLELPKETKTNQATPFMSSSNPLIGVDELHEKGIKGEGIKVGVIDTGIDHNHPDLKDNYKGEKEPGKSMDESLGWDFVDGDSEPMETTYKDWQNSDGAPEINPNSGSEYYTSHGTHVSGTIAGTGTNEGAEFATTGVAPEADLYAYRVLGPYGSGYTSDIMGGIEKSVEDGMDVINLSLGASINDPLFPTSVATNNAMLAGVVTIIANGNSGPMPGTVGSPGSASLPISVGASSTAIDIAKFKVEASNGVSTEGRLLGRDFTDSFTDIPEAEIVNCGEGQEWDIPQNVSGKIALIQRGSITLNQKVINAKNKGAVAVILYNNVDGEIENYIGEGKSFVPAVSIDKAAGEKLKASLEAQEKVTMKFNITENIQTKADELADFSSRGPANNGNIKPDVVAPGVSIMSTYPEYVNHPGEGEDYKEAYARISGTSMAAPHVAGVSALLLSEHKDYDPFDVKLALMNTSDDLSKKYGVNEMGAGRINAVEAISPQVVIKDEAITKTVDGNGEVVDIKHEVGSLSFGTKAISKKDTVIKDKLIIENNTDKNHNYDISVEYVTPTQTNGAQDAIKNKVKLDVKKNILANKNKETKLDISLKIPKNAAEGVYQGYIKLTNKKDKTQTHNIPFSVKYTEPGIAPIHLFIDSVTNEIDWVHPWLAPGLPVAFKVNTPVESIDIYVRDYETDKRIGYRGTMDGRFLIPDNMYQMSDALDMLLSVYPMDENENIKTLPMKLDEGKYKIEFVAKDKEGNTTSQSKPLVVDNTPATIYDTTLEGGVHEVNESMFTTEKDDSGVEHSALWVKGKVKDKGIEDLQSMGIDAKLSEVSMQATVNGRPYTSFRVDDGGNYKFGITMEDLEYGPMELRTLPLDIAGSLNYSLVPKYFFIKEGSPYIYTKANKTEVKEGEDVTITMDVNNIKNASTFDLSLEYFKGYKLKELKLNEEAKKLLAEKEYTAEINHTDDNSLFMGKVDIDVQIKDKEGNKVDIEGDIPLVDATFILEDDTYMDMYSSCFLSFNPVAKNKDGVNVEIAPNIIYDTIINKQTASVIKTGESAEGIIDSGTYDLAKFTKYSTVEDSKGNTYNVEFDDTEMVYYIKNLPVNEEVFTLVSNAPGHFKNYSKSKLYRNMDGELVGKNSFLYYQFASLAGDANGDGVIDLKDAEEVAKVYGNTSNIEGRDFNFDGKVDKTDMDYVVKNYQIMNPQEPNAPQPVEDKDGLKLKEILDKLN